jgi:hypothetical protein
MKGERIEDTVELSMSREAIADGFVGNSVDDKKHRFDCG